MWLAPVILTRKEWKLQPPQSSKIRDTLSIAVEYGAYVLAAALALFGLWLIIQLLGIFGVLLLVGTMVGLVVLKIGFLFFLK